MQVASLITTCCQTPNNNDTPPITNNKKLCCCVACAVPGIAGGIYCAHVGVISGLLAEIAVPSIGGILTGEAGVQSLECAASACAWISYRCHSSKNTSTRQTRLDAPLVQHMGDPKTVVPPPGQDAAQPTNSSLNQAGSAEPKATTTVQPMSEVTRLLNTSLFGGNASRHPLDETTYRTD